MLEFALILPLFLLMVSPASSTSGRAINYWIDTTHLASEGARLARRQPGSRRGGAISRITSAPRRTRKSCGTVASRSVPNRGSRSASSSPREAMTSATRSTVRVEDDVQVDPDHRRSRHELDDQGRGHPPTGTRAELQRLGARRDPPVPQGLAPRGTRRHGPDSRLLPPPVVIAFGCLRASMWATPSSTAATFSSRPMPPRWATGQEFARCRGATEADANDRDQGEGDRVSGGTRNPQIGGADAQGRVLTVLNSGSYDGALRLARRALRNGLRRRKADREGLASLLRRASATTITTGHARLQVLRFQSSNKLLPIAVEDPTPQPARAIFVDEITGATLADVR